MSLRYRYQTIEFGDVDIHLRTLRNRQEYLDIDGVAEKLGISSANWSLFGIVWPSSLVLAHYLFDRNVEGKRILEVGCGIGLASLLLNHLLADITATDYHPEAGNFLKKNVKLNKDKAIPFTRTGWADEEGELGRFDMIVGSDLLYEDEHAALLTAFIDRHAASGCEVIIVDPGRGNHARFSKMMIELGYSHSQFKPGEFNYLDKPFKGWILRYKHQ